MHRLDRHELVEALSVTPGEKPPARVEIRRAGVGVLDRDGEELEEAARSTGAGRSNQRRHDISGAGRGRNSTVAGWHKSL